MAKTSSGIEIQWAAEHKSGGRLISRQASITPPSPPACIRLSCLMRYLLDSLKFALLLSYHKRRVAYAEKNRNKEILERYRTGEPSPETIWHMIHASLKLTCRICRKYNVDPFLDFPDKLSPIKKPLKAIGIAVLILSIMALAVFIRMLI